MYYNISLYKECLIDDLTICNHGIYTLHCLMQIENKCNTVLTTKSIISSTF